MDKTVFISYSHKDRRWLSLVQEHLKPHVRNEDVAVWDDTKIQTGSRWRAEIAEALRSADAAILLVSRAFLASDFIAKHELPPLLEAADRRGLRICWIACGPSAFEATQIEQYQCANNPKRPLSKLSPHERDELLVRICRQIVGGEELEPPVAAPPKPGVQVAPSRGEPKSVSATCSDLQVAPSRLPVTGEFLFGRDAELKLLDNAWDTPQDASDRHRGAGRNRQDRLGQALARCRLSLAKSLPDEARGHFEEARVLVQKHGYHRRDPELKVLELALDPDERRSTPDATPGLDAEPSSA